MQSLVTASGRVEVYLDTVDIPSPQDDEVILRVEAAPINSLDIGAMLADADLSTLEMSGTSEDPKASAAVPGGRSASLLARIGRPMPIGIEGAGTVVGAGASPDAQALVGKTVAIRASGMFSDYRCVRAVDCLELPAGTTAAEGADCFVNPLTTLCMVETMRRDGHQALMNTAAASSLGQMLQRLCDEESIPLVNIVRTEDQAEILARMGADHVCNSNSPSFDDQLASSLRETWATMAFDATGGGDLASQILTAMEAATSSSSEGFSRYGSPVHKQVYVYGNLNKGPTVIGVNCVSSWGIYWRISGWLLARVLATLEPSHTREMWNRIARGLKGTFATTYAQTVSLTGALRPDAIAAYGQQSTGGKYLVVPQS
jgi:NADPH2:quinone reductase